MIYIEKIDLYKPIEPAITFDAWKSVPINECHQQLVSIDELVNDRVLFKAEFNKKGIPGAIKTGYVREQVADLLLLALKALPSGYSFLIYDAWRPFSVQKYLFDNYVKELLKSHVKQEYEIIKMAEEFVSRPSLDKNKPSPHFTGGAVDLTIIDDQGTTFEIENKYGIESHTRYYEEKLENGMELSSQEMYYCINRRILYNSMVSSGFTNYPNEWWHYDFGNQFWGFATKKTAIYGLVEKISFNRR